MLLACEEEGSCIEPVEVAEEEGSGRELVEVAEEEGIGSELVEVAVEGGIGRGDTEFVDDLFEILPVASGRDLSEDLELFLQLTEGLGLGHFCRDLFLLGLADLLVLEVCLSTFRDLRPKCGEFSVEVSFLLAMGAEASPGLSYCFVEKLLWRLFLARLRSCRSEGLCSERISECRFVQVSRSFWILSNIRFPPPVNVVIFLFDSKDYSSRQGSSISYP